MTVSPPMLKSKCTQRAPLCFWSLEKLFHLRCLRSIFRFSWKYFVRTIWVLEATGSYGLTILGQRRLLRGRHVRMMGDNGLSKIVRHSEPHKAPRPTGLPKLRFQGVLKRGLVTWTVLSPRGSLLGLSPQTQLPQIEIWNTIISGIFVKFECHSPPARMQSPPVQT